MTKKVAQNVTNSNSEDLTELYQKGKLPKGYYYLKKPDCEVMIITPSLRFMVDGYSILAEVPSYEEYIAMKKLISSKIDTRNNQDMLLAENTKLKELLEECVEYVKKGYGDYLTYTQSAIYQEINQVLGEE